MAVSARPVLVQQVRGDIGDATDDASEHLKGRAKEVEGKIQKNLGKVEQKWSEDE